MGQSHDTAEYDKIYTALNTPFEEGSYEVAEKDFRDLIQFHTNNGIFQKRGGFVVNPEAGEVFFLTPKERKRNVEIAVDEAGDDYNIFAGVYAPAPEDQLQGAEDAIEAGADGLFIMPPQGGLEVTTHMDAVNHPEIWVNHIKRIAQVGDVPLIIHPSAPGTIQYGEGVPVESAKEIWKSIPSVVGWKMTYNFSGFRRISDAIREHDRHVGSLVANPTQWNHAVIVNKYDGSVNGAINYGLEPMMEHVDALLEGDLERARKVYNSGLGALNNYVYSDFTRFHMRYKIATWLRGNVAHPFMRPPMPNPMEAEIRTLYSLLQDAGLDTRTESAVEETIDQIDVWEEKDQSPWRKQSPKHATDPSTSG